MTSIATIACEISYLSLLATAGDVLWETLLEQRAMRASYFQAITDIIIISVMDNQFKLWRGLTKLNINTLSLNILLPILQTDLHTFPMSWENLIKDQSIFPRVIILLNLITFSFDNVLILWGENWFSSLLGLQGLMWSLYCEWNNYYSLHFIVSWERHRQSSFAC